MVLGLGVLCVAVHELGHALAGYATGRQITEVVLFSLRPHVRLYGTASPAQDAFSAAAGSALVMLLWFCWLLLPYSARHRWITDVASSFAGVELLGWTLSSLLPPHGSSADDAVRFLAVSRVSPDLVVMVCVLLAVAGVAIRRSRRVRQCGAEVRKFLPVASNSCKNCCNLHIE